MDQSNLRIEGDVEYEVWMLQARAELWRRFLAANPEGQTLSETVMLVARLDPEPLEELMMTVVEDSEQARRVLEEFGPASSVN